MEDNLIRTDEIKKATSYVTFLRRYEVTLSLRQTSYSRFREKHLQLDNTILIVYLFKFNLKFVIDFYI